jgi:hypothetical protein
VKLPHAERAVVDVAKLRDYCLNPTHFRGRHKARVFASALGIAKEDAEVLRQALLAAALHSEAQLADSDRYGRRFVLDFEMATARGKARVRSFWMVRSSEDFPRLTSCYVL